MPTLNADRLRSDFDSLAEIGSTGDGGVNRPALGPAHREARAWFLERANAAGIETRVDGAGNHSAILRCGNPAARTLMLGSHLDSVPRGGRFDGALGVVAALEALRTVKEAGLDLPVHLEAMDFTDEEGTWGTLVGSRALAGLLTQDALATPRGGRDAFQEACAACALEPARFFSAKRDPASLAGYLELHIEQGPRLVGSGHSIGVVTGIVGIRGLRVTFDGASNHAGTTPMDQRRDAGLGAMAFGLLVRETAAAHAECVANVGRLDLQPGAFNIIPGRAELSLEFRGPTEGALDALEEQLRTGAETCARARDLDVSFTPAGQCATAPMSPRAQAAIAAAAERRGWTHTPLASGAGHDAQSMAAITDAGMVFIPSPGGVSHSPHEYSEWADCVRGAQVLLDATLLMASGPLAHVPGGKGVG